MSRVGTTHQRTSSRASAPGVKPFPQAEVLSPNDNSGNYARNITPENADSTYDRRETAQNFSRTANTNSSASTNPTNGPTQTNSSQDPNEPSGKNAFENIIDKGRAAVNKAGTALMWGAGGFAGFLYLVLGWKKLAMIIGGLGVGAGYLLNKLGGMGEPTDHHQRIVNEIRALKLQPEVEKKILTSLHEMFLNDAYKNSSGDNQWSDLGSQAAKATQAARDVASRVANSFNNQPSTQPA
jgi:hypothetical protein